MATNFEPHKCVIFVQSTKIGTHKNKAIHSIWIISYVQTLDQNICQKQKDINVKTPVANRPLKHWAHDL